MRNYYLNALLVGLFCVLGLTAKPQGCTVDAFASSTDILCGDTVRLGAAGSGVLAFRNNFNCGQVQCPQGDPNDPNANFGTWENSSTAQFDNPCNPQHPGNGAHIWFNQNTPSPRSLETTGLPLATGGSISWDMRFADPDFNGNNSPCENPDAADEGVALQYSVNNGATWTTLRYYGPGNGNDPTRTVWTRYQYTLATNLTPAPTNNTRIRWVQLGNTGTPGNYLDHWGMDNAEVIANPPNAKYTWQHTGIQRNDGATDPVTPVATTQYKVTYDDGTNTCTDTVTVNVRRQTVQIEQVPPGPLCPGDEVTLISEAEIGIPNYNCGVTTECQGSTRNVQLGMGQVEDNTYQALGAGTGGSVSLCSNGSGNYTNYARTQFIILASEFPNFIKGGQFYQILLNSANNGSWPNFTVSMGCTNKSTYASTADGQWETGLQTVYNSKTANLTVGWNILVLDQNFEWDGNSNIAVEICWRGSNQNGQFRKTNTPGRNSVIHNSSCSNQQCGAFAPVKAIDDNRPSFQVDMCYRIDPKLTYTWTPTTALGTPNEQNTTANPAQSTTYTLTVGGDNLPSQCDVQQSIDVNVISIGAFNPDWERPWCEGTDLKLLSGIPGAGNYDWSGPNGFTSTDENPVIDNADASYEGTYTLTVSNGNCSGTSTVDVTLEPLLKPGTPRDSVICQGDGPFNLEDLLTDFDIGVWSDDDGSGILYDNIVEVDSIANTSLPQTFAFSHTVTDTCGSRSSTVNLTIQPYFEAGEDNFDQLCESVGVVDLAGYLSDDADAGGRWEDPNSTNQLNGSNLNTNDLGFGVYTFWYIHDMDAPCLNDTAKIELTIENQPYAGANGAGAICVDETINLSLLLGNNPDAGGTWTELTASGGVITGSDYDATGVVAGTYRFKYSIDAVSPCVVSESFVDLTVNDNPVISDVQIICAGDAQNYYVTFSVSGGDPATYAANIPGTFDGNGNFTSGLIPSQQATTITISDVNDCGGATINVNKKCDCETVTSDMRTDTLVVACEGQTAQGIDLGGYFSDGNDTIAYYLHEGNGPALENAIDSNHTGIFSFQAPMVYGTTYYVSSAAADNSGSDYPDRKDPCFTVAQGTPVVFFRAPISTLTVSPNPICPGDQSTLTVNTVNGKAPFDIVVSGGPGVNYSGVGRNSSQQVSVVSNTTFTVTNVVDVNGCAGTGNSVNLDVNQAPTATLSSGTDCDGNANIDIAVTGSGTQWTVYLNNSLNGNQEVITCDANGYSAPPTYVDNDSIVTYFIDSVVDNSGSICTGVPSGQYNVNPIVSGFITGVDSAYCPGNPLLFSFDLTGIGPWDIDLDNGQGGLSTVTVNDRNGSVTVPNALASGNYTFTITNITDNGTGCTGSGSGSVAVTINPGPNAQVGFDLVDPTDMNPSKQDTLCVGTNGTIDFQYLSGSGTLTVRWLLDGLTQTPVSVNQGTKTSVPFTQTGSSKDFEVRILSVTDNTTAGCTGGGDVAQIHVKNLPSVNPTIPTEVCEGSQVQFTYNSTGEGMVTFDLLDQNSNVLGTYSQAPGSNTGTFTAPAPGNYTLSITNIFDGGAQSCVGQNTSTFPLQVNPTPDFILTQGSVDICEGNTANVPFTVSGNGPFNLDYTVTGSGGYSNTFSRSASANGNLSIPNLPAGTYTVTPTNITETGGAGCSNAGTGSTTINVNPSAFITNMGFTDNPICEGDQTRFTFQVNGNGPYTVQYSDGMGGNFTANVPSNGQFTSAPFTPTGTTSFTITDITDGNNPNCPANLPSPTELVVNPAPQLQFTSGSKICENQNAATVSYTIGGGAGPYTVDYQDQNNKTYQINLNGGSGTFSFNQLGGNDSLELTPVAITNTSTGCVGTVSGLARVISKPLPNANIQYLPALVGCAPFTPVAFFDRDNNYDTRTANWVWNYQEGQSATNSDSIYPVLLNPNQSAQVDLSVTTIHGCSNSSSVTFSSFSEPVARFEYGPGEPTTMQSEISFRSTSSQDASKYLWTVNDQAVSSKSRFSYDFPAEPGLFDVCLTATNNGGCADVICKLIEVKGVLQVYIPSAFTPDGDGINDVFRPVVTRAMQGQYSFKIYNRWGELLFETTDPEIGWDGTGVQNEEVPPGIYVYKIRLVSEFDEKEEFSETGTITVTK